MDINTIKDNLHFLSNSFDFTIEEMNFGNCISVSDITLNLDKVPTYESDTLDYRKGQAYMDDIVVCREMSDFKMFDWFKDCQNKKVIKRSASLIIKNESQMEMGRFDFLNIWPIAYNGPDFNKSGTNSLAIETITFACSDIVKGK